MIKTNFKISLSNPLICINISAELMFLMLLLFINTEISSQNKTSKSYKSDSTGYVFVTGHVEKGYQTLDKALVIITVSTMNVM